LKLLEKKISDAEKQKQEDIIKVREIKQIEKKEKVGWLEVA
jgi:hypothetical protein